MTPAPENPHGFTLIEVLFVLVVTAILLSAVVRGFAAYTQERSAQQAAYLLSRDLRLTRATAISSRQPVSLVVSPRERVYVIRDTLGTVVARRTFAAGDLMVDSLEMGLPGDSVTFDSRGLADLSAAGGPLVEATIGAGGHAYVVRFNATGSSNIVKR